MKQIFLLVFVLITPAVMAQNMDSTAAKKLDTILYIQKQMYREIKDEPTVGKKIGIEINPARLLLYGLIPTVSGSISFFDVHPKVELAFPAFYGASIFAPIEDYRNIIVDCQYRYFLGNTRNGFFIFPAARLTNIEGYRGTPGVSYLANQSKSNFDNITKFGIGAGFGVRIFSYSGFYWGSSLSFGSYIIGKNNHFLGEVSDVPFITSDSKYWINFEALKFGWAF